jgi:Ni/Co efflux regulator RcnB
MPGDHKEQAEQQLARPRSKSQDDEARHDRKRHHHARRSRSPRRDEDRHRHKRHRSRSPPSKPVALPYRAKPLSKRHYEDYKPLFQSYLDIQKNIQLDELDEREAKGRWKSFTSRWYAISPSLAYASLEDVEELTLQESWRSRT